MILLVTAPFFEEELERLRRFGDVAYRPWKANGRAHTAEELIAMLHETGAQGLIVEHDPVPAEVFAVDSLQWVGVCRGTPSNVDVAAATRHGVPVFRTPARNAQAVAEYVIGEVIAMLRHIPESRAWLRERRWTDSSHASYLQFRGSELSGKTIGLVGLGGVGRRLAALLRPFGCRIQYFDPHLEASPDPGYAPVALEELFATSDIVSVHLPVTKETQGMIDGRLLGLMKKDAIFVNSARAAVVERTALLAALKERSIAGAIVDVYYAEPPDERDYELVDLPNVQATPHLAGNTFEVDRYHARMMLDALSEWLQRAVGTELLYNPEALARLRGRPEAGGSLV